MYLLETHLQFSPEHFIGVDVSKNKLDFAVLSADKKLLLHREIKNVPTAISAFLDELKTSEGLNLKKAVFCMEATGFYCNHLIDALHGRKVNFAVENPLHIKRSLGIVREKTDGGDSVLIAHFAQKTADTLRLWLPKRPVLITLMSLTLIRDRLIRIINMLEVPLNEADGFLPREQDRANRSVSKRSLTALRNDLKKVEKKIKLAVKNDRALAHLYQLVTSVPGVGPLTAVQILITTNEFRSITNAKKFACYAGIAPFKNESGLSRKRGRVSHIANKKIKSLLHMCAMKAITWDPELRSYYQRRTQMDKKPKMLVLNAVRNKLVHRVFTCIRMNRSYVRLTDGNFNPQNLLDPTGVETRETVSTFYER
ncbi:MAG TPA: IS110 family transposase [Mucilaginibacter sp.]